jgi:hypothetical protein
MRPEWFPQAGGGSSAAVPSFVVGGTSVAATTPTVTLAGVQTGDVIIGAQFGATQFPSAPVYWALVLNGFNDSGTFLNIYYRIVTPQDSTSFILGNNTTSCTAMAAFRHVLPIDGISATANTGVTTSPASNTFTTTILNGIGIWVDGFGAGSGTATATAAPTGYTFGANVAAVFGAHFGISIAYKTGLSVGAQGTLTGTLSATAAQWAALAFALHP